MHKRTFGALTLAALWILQPAPGSAVAGSGSGEFIDAFVWRIPERWFGGFSGLEVSDDGMRFTSQSDRGLIVAGDFLREGDRITGVRNLQVRELTGPDGHHLADHDIEGLALDGKGGFYVSFEGSAPHIGHWTGFDAPETVLPSPREFSEMQVNASLEALAVDRFGNVYTLPERSGREDRPFPVHRWDGTRWTQPFSISRSGDFLAVGADFGPDGRLYLLERDFTGIFGFRSRVRSFKVDGDSISDEQVVLVSKTGSFDNLEGISAWRDADGHIRLTMISDDNFNLFEVTEFVEYRIP